MDKTTEQILRRRMHGMYLSRQCDSLYELARELLGMNSWLHQNVVFSAIIRGAPITGWNSELTKTWLYRGTCYGAVFDQLPLLLAIHSDDRPWDCFRFGDDAVDQAAERVLSLIEDGVCSRNEMYQIFYNEYDAETANRLISSGHGILFYLARRGKVAFKSMTSRDFDLISAEPTLTPEHAIPQLLRHYFKTYGPATLSDAVYFLGLNGKYAKQLHIVDLDDFSRLEYNGNTYYYVDGGTDMGDIPRLTLLSGLDPYLAAYADKSFAIPKTYRQEVLLKSNVYPPTIALDGQIIGTWNIKKEEPRVEFFTSQPQQIRNSAIDLVDFIRWHMLGACYILFC